MRKIYRINRRKIARVYFRLLRKYKPKKPRAILSLEDVIKRESILYSHNGIVRIGSAMRDTLEHKIFVESCWTLVYEDRDLLYFSNRGDQALVIEREKFLKYNRAKIAKEEKNRYKL